jgi:hypothetical protein
MALITGVPAGPDAGILDLVAGLAAANGGGDSFFMTGRDLLVVNNASGGAITVTISTVVAAVADNFGVTNAAHDKVFSVAAGKIAVLGPFTLGRFKDANGNAQVTYSGVTSLTVGVLRVSPTA